MSSLEQQAHEALAAIMAAPAVVFENSAANQARWSAAIAHLAQAAAILAELADGGDEDALEHAGDLGDSVLVGDAREFASEVRELLGRLVGLDLREAYRGYGEDLASGQCAGPQGQRRLIAIAAKLAERFPARPEVTT